MDLGATRDSTLAIFKAWALACASTHPSAIYIPPGTFFVTNLLFKGPCNNNAIVVRLSGTLIAPSHIGNVPYWIHFIGVDGLTIVGGTLDGHGAVLWECKRRHGRNCRDGATNLGITNSRNVWIEGLTSINSQMFHIVVNECENVLLEGVTVFASENSPNTDGIHVQLSRGVTILNSEISTGDDCISIGPGAAHLWIEDVGCGPGHGISIGSLGKDYEEEGVVNVTVKGARFKETQNGLRIKTWGRASKGFARNVVFQHAIMTNVHNPIVIDQNYCPHNHDCPGQVSGVKISDVSYKDIEGTSASEVAVRLECSKKKPCERIKMENVNLIYNNHPARASCSNAVGSAIALSTPDTCL